MRRLFNQGKEGEGPSGADDATDNQRRRIARELGSPRAIDRTNSMNVSNITLYLLLFII